ncbi:MAG: protein kinase [Acidobacteriota bacterium]
MTIAPGTRLGPYEILSPLGAGGMGEVYRARDTRLGREVAIKALPSIFAADPERLARFRREAQTLASLNHPNIASIYGLDEDGGAPHLVLELVEGETLAARLARGALPPREALQVGIQVAAAVEGAHERGIVHRDLKPGNVMITPAGTAKVLDFGLAKSDEPPPERQGQADSPTMTAHPGATAVGAVLGTAAYMSPEQARGRPVDRRSDIWSFGCVLFECFTGRPAFSGETVSDLIARILEREPDWASLPAGTPPRVRDILKRCLRKDAEARPRDIRDVRLELSEVAAGGTPGEGAGAHSIAVLPFNNLSGPDDEYFSDGVTDEILNALAHVEGLRVAARTSCFAFKGRREDLRAIGEKLDVATILEGTVRRSGSRLRITAQLVNAADGYQLWSERYDREMTDVFEVQDELAGAIAARLSIASRGGGGQVPPRRGTASVEAYELFLKGRALLVLRGRFILLAIPFLDRALELDPRYADAMAWLADARRLTGTFGSAPSSEVMPRAKAMAQKALAIAPDMAEAWATLASVEAQYDRDAARAEESWSRALKADPRHGRSICERALWSFGLGTMSGQRAVEETGRAAADDPLNAWVAAQHALLLCYAGRFEEAVAAGERAVDIDADSFLAQWVLLQALLSKGDLHRTLAMAPALLSISGRHTWVLGTMAFVQTRSGNPDLARAVFGELEARSRYEFVAPYWLAAASSAAGLGDLAIGYARRAVVERDPMVVLARTMPQWEGILADTRMEDLVREVWG